MTIRVTVGDESYGSWYRVNGAATDDEAIAAATQAWQQDDRRWSDDEDDAPRFIVDEAGWYRCIPCICGDGHSHDLWPASEGERGAFYCRLIGMGGAP
jgi:hypothetical protein